ncbi:hypothetical protein [Bordetella genomosp. 9]|uniref:hypothetical protein n=1 Tax=Bordetella genomosp. 9 TaxID=1416803 RepID=UPI0011780D8B|nr:hypothetical protein [Bordetella genomosp. 9]
MDSSHQDPNTAVNPAEAVGSDVPGQPASHRAIPNKFVAFCDILGFSNRVLHDLEKTIDAYEQFCGSFDVQPLTDVDVTIYSDALLIVGDELLPVLKAVQMAWFFSLTRDLVLRGGISYGRFYSRRTTSGLLIVSDALIRAVRLEDTVKMPLVQIDDTIQLDDMWWPYHFVRSNLELPYLHFEGRNLVNPFNIMWFQSAATRMRQLMDETTDPHHLEKYEWFLRLWRAVDEGNPMAPPGVRERLLEAGVLQWTPDSGSESRQLDA